MQINSVGLSDSVIQTLVRVSFERAKRAWLRGDGPGVRRFLRWLTMQPVALRERLLAALDGNDKAQLLVMVMGSHAKGRSELRRLLEGQTTT